MCKCISKPIDNEFINKRIVSVILWSITVVQTVEHGTSNTKVMGLFSRKCKNRGSVFHECNVHYNSKAQEDF